MKTNELIELLIEQHPYPNDLFDEPTKEEWTEFHVACSVAGFSSAPFVGTAARMGYNACISRMKEILKKQ